MKLADSASNWQWKYELSMIFVASNKFSAKKNFLKKKEKKKTSEKRDITPNISLNLCFLILFLLHLHYP